MTEHDYIGLCTTSTSCSSSSGGDAVPDLNESATALCLGPPKSEEVVVLRAPAPRNSAILEEFRKAQAAKAQQPLQGPGFFSSKGYGVKRGFSEVDVKVQTSWMPHSPYSSCKPGKKNEPAAAMAPVAAAAAAPIDPPAPGQTVGWPPVRSFVRNNAPPPPTPASAQTDSQEKEKEMPSLSSSAAKSLFVKIYMDGVPFGRKVDLKTNNRYEKLYSALEEMFHQFLNGHYSGSQTSTSSSKSHFVSSSISSSRKHNFLDGSEYVLIYEDHEGDFMLVGDVPWELFVNTVKRLRIMKGSEEVNLAPKNTDPAVKTQPAVG